jgi:hypothetical protein
MFVCLTRRNNREYQKIWHIAFFALNVAGLVKCNIFPTYYRNNRKFVMPSYLTQACMSLRHIYIYIY